jgi:hypothetical protein
MRDLHFPAALEILVTSVTSVVLGLGVVAIGQHDWPGFELYEQLSSCPYLGRFCMYRELITSASRGRLHCNRVLMQHSFNGCALLGLRQAEAVWCAIPSSHPS